MRAIHESITQIGGFLFCVRKWVVWNKCIMCVLIWHVLRISSRLIQQVCYAAQQDGLKHPHVERFAAAGSHGVWTQNIDRDIKLALHKPSLEEAVSFERLPWKNNQTEIVFRDTAVLWPHAAFASIYKNHPVAFKEKLLGDFGHLEAFWDEMYGNPALLGSPVLSRPHYRTRCVPVSRFLIACVPLDSIHPSSLIGSLLIVCVSPDCMRPS